MSAIHFMFNSTVISVLRLREIRTTEIAERVERREWYQLFQLEGEIIGNRALGRIQHSCIKKRLVPTIGMKRSLGEEADESRYGNLVRRENRGQADGFQNPDQSTCGTTASSNQKLQSPIHSRL